MIDKYILETILQKRRHNECTKPIKKGSKEVKCDKFCFCKVGGTIFLWGALEKSPILLLLLLSQYWKK